MRRQNTKGTDAMKKIYAARPVAVRTDIVIESTDGGTYSVVASDQGNGFWTANIAQVAQDGSVLRECLTDDEFSAEFGDIGSCRAALQYAAGKVIF
jgi:hypothetical protein